MKAKFNKQKGITLVALVITVIVLLILAGTAITVGLSGDGLFERTNSAVEKWNNKVGEEENAVNEVFNFLNPPEIILAENKLLVNIEDAEASNEEKSPYVNYRWKSGEPPILCRVLYDKNDAYDVQIIAINQVGTVALGSDTSRTTSYYDSAIETLNNEAEKYMDTVNGTGICKDARCVGSNPSYKDSHGSRKTLNLKGIDYTFNDEDFNYETDMNRMILLDMWNTTYEYWLASCSPSWRLNSTNKGDAWWSVRKYYTAYGDWGPSAESILTWKDGTFTPHSVTNGFRPVFILNSTVKIVSGSGTINDPYELSL